MKLFSTKQFNPPNNLREYIVKRISLMLFILLLVITAAMLVPLTTILGSQLGIHTGLFAKLGGPAKVASVPDKSLPEVLAEFDASSSASTSPRINFNIVTNFKDDVFVDGQLLVQGKGIFPSGIEAPNVVYSIKPGPGIVITGDPQNVEISSNGVTSFQGESGQIELVGGNGIRVDGLNISSTGVTSIGGQTGDITLTAGSGITISGTTISADIPDIGSDTGSAQNIFKNIAVTGQSSIIADSNNDTLTFAPGSGITLTTNTSTKTVTIASSSILTASGFADDGTVVRLTDPNDSVGIGTSAPLSKFSVGTNSEFQVNATGAIAAATGITSSGSVTFSGLAGSSRLLRVDAGGTVQVVADGSTGQFLGTDGAGNYSWSSPSGLGDITAVGSVNSGAAFQDASADGQWLGLGSSAGQITFRDLATDNVNILNANVGIGTSTPSYRLEVAGDIKVGDGSLMLLGNAAADPASAADGAIYYRTSDNRFRCRESGTWKFCDTSTGGALSGNGAAGQVAVYSGPNTLAGTNSFFWDTTNSRLGIGTSTPTVALDVTGNLSVSGTGAFGAVTATGNGGFATVTTSAQGGLTINPYGVSAGNTGEARFSELAANGTNYVGFKAPDNVTSNLVWTLPSSDGSNNYVLTTNGAGVTSWAAVTGAGSVTGSGTTNTIPRFTSSNTVGDSGFTDNGSLLGLTRDLNFSAATPSLSITNGETLSITDGTNTLLSLADGGTSGNLSGIGNLTAGGTVTISSLGTGIAHVSSGGVLSSSAVNLTTSDVTGVLGVANGGTGIATAAGNGQLLIGNGTGYTLASITNGTGVSVTNGSGTITIANTGVTSIAGTTNQVTASAATGGVTLSLPQNINSTANVNFGSLTTSAQGAFVANPYGSSTGNTGEIRFSELAAGGTNYVGFKAPDSVASNVIWTLPSADGSSNYVLTTNGAGVTSWNSVSGVGGLSGSGTTNAIPRFTSSSSIGDSGLSDNGSLIGISRDISFTASTPNIAITNTETLTITDGTNTLLSLADGGTSGNLSGLGNITATGTITFSGLGSGIAHVSAGGVLSSSAVNLATSDVTGTLAIGNGGTGITGTASNGQLLIGNGTGYTLAALTAGSGIGVTNASGSITIANTGVTSITGTTNQVTASAATGGVTLSLPQDINTSANVNFGTVTTSAQGAFLANPYGSSAGNTGEVRFGELAANGTNYVGFKAPNSIASNAIWTLPSADGSSNYVLTTNGSGALSWNSITGVGSITGSGTTNTVPRFTSSSTIGDSGITDDGSVIGISRDISFTASTPNIAITNGETFTITDGTNQLFTLADAGTRGNLSNINNFTAAGTITFSGLGTGIAHLDSSGVVSSSAVNLANTDVTGTLTTGKGGTGITGTASNGQLLIGNGTGYTLAALTAGSGIGVTNASGSITIANTGVTSITGTANQVTASAGTGAVTLSLPQNINTTANVNFGSVTTSAQGAFVANPYGSSTGNTGEVRFSELATNGTNYVGFKAGDSIGSNVIWTLPSSDGTNNYVLTTNGSGVLSWNSISGVGSITGSGTTNTIPRFTSSSTVGDSGLTDDGSLIGISRDINFTASTPNIAIANTETFTITDGTNTLFTLADAGTRGNLSSINNFTAAGTITFSGLGTGIAHLDSSGVVTSSAVNLANSDVTGTLPIGKGGTGITGTATNGQLLIGNGTGYTLAALTAGSGIGVTNASGSITIANTGVTSITGTTNQVTTSGATGAVTLSLPQNINTTADVNFGSVTTSAQGAFVANPYGASAGNTGEVRFSELAANGTNYVGFKAPNSIASNAIWTLPSADGTNNYVLTTNGSGVLSWNSVSGVGGLSGSGTTNTIPRFTSASSIGDSGLTDDGSLIGISRDISFTAATPNIAISNTETFTITDGTNTLFSLADAGTRGNLSGLGNLTAAGTVTFSGLGTGIGHFDSSGVLTSSAVNLASADVTGTLTIGKGGTGITGTATNGQLLIGNGTGYTLAALTAGSGIGVTNASGSITIANTGVTSITGTSNQVTASAATGAVTLSLPQNINTTADVNFGSVTTSAQGAFVANPYGTSAGNTGEARFSELAANGTNYVGFKAPNSIASNQIWTLPSADGTNNYVLTTNGSGVLSWNSVSGVGALSGSGTTNTIPRFTGASSIGDSGLTDDGSLIGISRDISFTAATPNIAITNTETFTITDGTNTLLSLADGGTSGNLSGLGNLTAGGTITFSGLGTGIGHFNSSGVLTSSAVNLANSDVTGTLAIGNGGTGITGTATNGQLLIGNGTGYTLAALTAGSGIGVTNASGSITIANTGVTSITGTTNQVTASASTGAVTLSLPQNINTTANVNFGSVTTSAQGAFVANPYGTSAGNTGEARFSELAANGTNYVGFKAPDTLSGNQIWTLPSADGTNNYVLTTNGSGVLSWNSVSGVGALSGSGTTNTIPRFTGATSIGDSGLTDDGSVIGISRDISFTAATPNIAITNTETFTITDGSNTLLSLADGGTSGNLTGLGNLTAGGTITFSGLGTGIAHLSSGGVLSSSAVNLANSDVTGTLPIGKGGTGITGTASNGQLLIGTGTGYSLAALTAGSGIGVTNASGSITIANTGVTSITGTTNQVTASASTGAITLSLPQNINTTADVNFGSVTTSAQGAFVANPYGTSAGNTGEARFSELAANGTNYVGFKAPNSITANQIWTLPSADGSNNYVLTTNGSGALAWSSVSGAGGLAGSGTQNYVAKFSSGNSIADSILYDDGSSVGIGTSAPGAKLDVNGDLQLRARGDVRFADSDSSNYVGFQAPATVTSNVVWTLPSADGSSNYVLSTDGSGTLSWSSVSGVGGLSGSGTTNALARFTGASSIGDSGITDDGSLLGFTRDISFTAATPNIAISNTETLTITDGTNTLLTLADNGTRGTLGINTINASGTYTYTGTGANGIQLNPYNTSTGNTSEIRFTELAANGTNYIGFKAPDNISANQIWTLPSTDGSNNYVLSTNGSGVLSWVSQSGGISGSGTTNTIPRFTSASALGDSGLTDDGSVIGITRDISFTAATPNIAITNAETFTITDGTNTLLSLADGGTSGNLSGLGNLTAGGTITFSGLGTGIAHLSSGGVLSSSAVNLANSDVTGTLPIGKGGTGVTGTATNGQLLIGNGTGYTLAALTAGSGIGVTNASGSITIANTGVTSITGTSNQVTASASTGAVTLSLPQNINTTADVNFGSVTTSAQGAFVANPYGTSAGNTGEVRFSELAANGTNYVGFKAPNSITANQVWTLPSADGSNNYVLTTNGSGVTSWASVSGVGGLSGSGTTNSIARFTGATSIGDSGLTDDGSVIGITRDISFTAATPNIAITNTETFTITDGTNTLFSLADAGTRGNLSGLGNLTAAGTVTFSGLGTGIGHFDSSGVLTSSAVNLASADVTGTLTIGKGGTGVTGTATNGQLLIGNGTGYTLAALTAGSGIGVTNAAGSITIANTGVTSITGTANQVTASASTGAVTLSLPQNINTTADVNFGSVTTSAQGAFVANPYGTSAGNTGEARFSELAANGTNYVGFKAPNSISANQIWTLPSADGSNNYVLTTNGSGVTSWASVSGIGGLNGSGTTNTIARFTGASSLGDSGLTDDGSVIGITRDISFTAATPNIAITNGETFTITDGTNTLFTLADAGTRGNLSNINNFTAAGTVTFSGLGTGIGHFDSSGVLTSSAVNLASADVTGTLTIGKGGTGITGTATNGQLLIGNGTGYTLAALTAGSGIGVTNAAGSITIANTGVTSITGTTNQVTASASTGAVTLSLPQNINTTANVNFGSVTTSAQGAFVANPYGTSAGNTGEIRFGELAASGTNYVGFKAPDTIGANQIWTLPSADGSNNYVLTTDGSGTLAWNSIGGAGGLSGSGTTNSIPRFTSASALGDSGLTDNGSVIGITRDISFTAATPNIAITNTETFTITDGTNTLFSLADAGTLGNLSNINNFTAAGTVTFSGLGTGIGHFDSSGVLTSSAVNLASADVTGTLTIGKGGTGITGTASNGQLLIGNGTGYTLAALTAGSGIGVTNASGSITIANTGVTSITGTTNQVTASASTGAVTLSLPQDINSTANVNFGSVTTSAQGGFVANPYGTSTGNTGEVRFKELAASGTNYIALKAPDTLAGDTPYTLPSAYPGASGYVLSSTTGGVMSWVATSSGLGGTGTTNNIARWTGATTLGDSGLTDDGSVIGISRDISFTASTPNIAITNGETFTITDGTNTLFSLADAGTRGNLSGLGNLTAAGTVTFSGLGTGIGHFDSSGVLTSSAVDLATADVTGTLTIGKGGTGVTGTATNGQLLIGNGTGYTLAALTAGSGIGVTNAAGSITIANTGVTSITGTSNQVTASASTGAVTLSLPQSINTTANVNFGSVTTSAQGGIVANPYGTSAGNTGEVRFSELAANGTNYVGFKAPDTLSGNQIWTLPSADGTNNYVLTTNGSGVTSWASVTGIGGLSGSGTTNTIPRFTSASALGDSGLTDNGSVIGITRDISFTAATPNIAITNTETFTITDGTNTLLSLADGGTSGNLTGLGNLTAGGTITFSGLGTGIAHLSSGGVLSSSAVNLASSDITGTLGVGNGGTGITGTAANGQLLIGNGTGYTLAALTAGTGIGVTNGSGTITLANTGVTSITGTTNQVNASASTGSVTLSLPQSINTTASVNFGAVTTSGQGALTANPFSTSPGNTGEVRFSELASGGTNYVGFKAPDAIGTNVIWTLPSADGSSNYVLTTNGSGTTQWQSISGTGAITSLNTLTASTQTFATGTSGTDFNISSSSSTHTFNIPDASSSNRGLITTGTQTIAGSKTFSVAPTFSTMTAGSLYFAGTGGVVSQNNNNLFWDNTNTYLGLGTSTPATKLDVTGVALNTDADQKVGLANFTGSLTKNDTNSRTFYGVNIKPTLNAGASNASTTYNILNVDTTNTAVTGLTTNLLRLASGGTTRLTVSDAGNLSLTSTTASSNPFSVTANSLTSGTGSLIASSSTAMTGNIGHFTLTGNATANTGTILKASSTGALNTGVVAMVSNAGTGLGLRVNDDGTDTDSTAFVVDSTGQVGIGTTNPGTNLDVNGHARLQAQGELRFADSDSSNYVGFKSPATVGSNQIWTLPSADGSNNYVLTTNGSGVTSWASVSGIGGLNGSGTTNAIARFTGTSTLGDSGLTDDGSVIGITRDISFTATTPNIAITNAETFTITDGTNTLLSLADNGTAGTLTVGTIGAHIQSGNITGSGSPTISGYGTINGATLSGGTLSGGTYSNTGFTVTGNYTGTIANAGTFNLSDGTNNIFTLTDGGTVGNLSNIGTLSAGAGTFTVNGTGAITAASGIASSGTIAFSGLSTNGLVKTTGGTGTLAVATAGTDYQVPLTFSTGLTNTSNTITANLSTGVAGGQTAIGGTASGNNLTLSSTSNGTKGKIILGSASAYDEANDRLGIGTSTPATKLDIVGSTLNTDADATVSSANLTSTLTKNDTNTRTFYGVNINPTINTGASNTTTTFNALNIGTTETAVTGTTINLLRLASGATQRFVVTNGGNFTMSSGAVGSTGLAVAVNSLTSGLGLNVSSSATAMTGNIGQFSLSGNATANTGNVLKVENTGASSAVTTLMVSNAGTGNSLRVNDDGTDTDSTPFIIDSSGNVAIGATTAAATLDVRSANSSNTPGIYSSYTRTSGSTNANAYEGLTTVTSSSLVGFASGINGQLNYQGSGGISNANGGRFVVAISTSAPGTANGTGVSGEATTSVAASSVTGLSATTWGNTGAGTLSSARGVSIASPINSGGGTITNAYGLYINPISVGATNYSIYSNGGQSFFSGNVGIGNSAPATKLDITGLTLNTDADQTVMVENQTGSITKNDTNTRQFYGLKIKPTLNTGASNTNTTFNAIDLDTTNTAVTGLTTNLMKLSYGGSQRLLVGSAGNVQISPSAANGIQLDPFSTSAGNTAEMRFMELAANGTNYVGFKAPDTISSNLIWTLPSSDGSSNYVLTTNGSGVTSWQSVNGVNGVTATSPTTNTIPRFAAGNTLVDSALTDNGTVIGIGRDISFTASTPSIAITNAETLTVTDGTNTLLSLADNGTAGTLTVGTIGAHIQSGNITGSGSPTISGYGTINGATLSGGTLSGGTYSNTGFTVTGNYTGTIANAGNFNLNDGTNNIFTLTDGGTVGNISNIGSISAGSGTFTVSTGGAISAATGVTSSGTINFSGLSTNGLVKTTGGTGTLAVATAGTDYQAPLTFSTGLTNTTNTITANLSTGVAGGQTAIGGTASGNNLTLSSTSNGTKGKIILGSASAYDEANDRLGLGLTGPSYKLDITDTATTAGIRGVNVLQSGAISGTGYAGYFSKTGASTTNVGLYAQASGATNNYAAIFENGYVGIGNTAPGTRLDITGLTLNTDATNTVMAENITGSITKNDTTTRQFYGLKIKPTLNTGASNTTTTLNVFDIDTTNTAVTGLTTNLMRLAYGGSQKFLVDSTGAMTAAGAVTLSNYSTGLAHLDASGVLTSSAVNLANADVTGTLPVGNGGTGVTGTPTNGQLLIGNGTGYTVGTLTAGTGIGVTNGAGSITLTANLSTGVSGGQTAIGGTGASENLTLSSTSNGTKGKIILGSNSAYDEANTRLGIGTSGPAAKIESLGTTEQLRLSYDASNYGSFTTNSTGDLTIAPTGGDTTVTGTLTSTGALAGATVTDGTTTFADTAWTSTAGVAWDLANSSTTALNIESGLLNLDTANSRVGIGTSAPAAKLDVTTTGTTSNALNLTANSLTTGYIANLTSTSTSYSSGRFLNLEWNPASTTTATGDLARISINGNANIGNFLNIVDNNNSLFSISETALTSSLPTSFTAPGDMSLSYDLNFTNQTNSAIKSNASLTLDAGESFESNDLILKTYNSGKIVGLTTSGGMDLSTSSSGTQLRFGSDQLDAGGYLVSASASQAVLSGGASWNGTNWTAKSTTASLVNASSGSIGFNANTGLTVGNTFTPTAIATITTTGLGVGTTSPSWATSIVGTQATSSIANITNLSTAVNTTTNVLRLGVGSSTTSTSPRFVIFYAGATSDSNGTAVGHINLNNNAVAYTTTGADFGEYFDNIEPIATGEIAALTANGIKKATTTDSQVIGVVSDTTGFVGNAPGETNSDKPLVGLVGQIRTKVDTSNGPIKKGDFITVSGVNAGVGAKSTTAGFSVGQALEDYTGAGIGTIKVLVKSTYVDPKNIAGQMSMDSNGFITTPKLKADKIALGTSGFDLETVVNAQNTVLTTQANTLSSLSAAQTTSQATLTDRMDKMDHDIATMSAALAQVNNADVSHVASIEAGLASLEQRTTSLEETVASLSAKLNDLVINNTTATDSGSLATSSATLDNLTVTNNANVNNLGITGTISAGNMMIEGLDSMNESAINTLGGTLKLQSLGVNSIEFEAGQIVMDTTGNMKVAGSLTTSKVKIDTSDVLSASAGKSNISAGQTSVVISTTAVKADSLIFVTATSKTGQVLSVSNQVVGSSFTVNMPAVAAQNVNFNWWIVDSVSQ